MTHGPVTASLSIPLDLQASGLTGPLDRADADPAAFSMRGRLLADRAQHADGEERQILCREASSAFARAGQIAADLAGEYARQADECSGAHAAHPLIRERLLRGRIEKEPHNMELKTGWIALQSELAVADAEAGDLKKAGNRLIRASKAVNEMIAFDPDNETWIAQRDRLDCDIARIAAAFGPA
ncbi:MAG TPA: hypothetical protein VHU87_02005 [Rhizomicrobium sp.]|jgi:hypothetical protein|nr:hypothetical protein [Rhizomicrobium sp.]